MPLRMLAAYEQTVLPCDIIRRKLEKAFGEWNVEAVPKFEPSAANPLTVAEAAAYMEGADCLVKIKRMGTLTRFASESGAFFKDGKLVESDLIVKLSPEDEEVQANTPDFDPFWEAVEDYVFDHAKSCKLRDVHEHEYQNLEEPGASPNQAGIYEHLHLTGCSVDDFIKVAQAFGH